MFPTQPVAEMFHVKPKDRLALEAQLRTYLAEAAVPVTGGQITALLDHLRMVLEVNLNHNLTAIRNPQEALRLHAIDSIMALDSLPAMSRRLVDIGSGQGYPAIPFAILKPSMQVTMIESVGRKAQFLEAAIHNLGIADRVNVLNCRAECVPEETLSAYDVVTARAVASLASLVELASPLLRFSGVLVAMKGSPEVSELQAANLAAVRCGMSPGLHHEYRLTGGEERRMISRYEKVGPPLVQLPRRVGLAQKRPLK